MNILVRIIKNNSYLDSFCTDTVSIDPENLSKTIEYPSNQMIGHINSIPHKKKVER